MDYVYVFNTFEVILWLAIGMTLLARIPRQQRWRGRLLVSGLGFLVFAGTDVVELQTGAWWRPWWLFAWKAGCVILLAVVGIYHYRNRKAPKN